MTQTLLHSIRRSPAVWRGWQGLALAFATGMLPVRALDFTLGGSSEVASATDVLLVDSEMFLRWRDSQREVTLLLGGAEIDLDYRPPAINLLGRAQDLSEPKQSGQITWREGLDHPLQWTFSGGGYQGFTDYQITLAR